MNGNRTIGTMRPHLIGNFIYNLSRFICWTVRLESTGEEKIADLHKKHGGVILVTWHGRTLIPINHYRGRGYWAFVSTSRDGEYQNIVLQRYGFHRVRGSTSSRGAVTAALKMAKELRNGAILTHTPDGPRGPSHSVHAGAIFLAEKSGCPILPAGVSAYPRKLLGTWDKFLVPKLFARAVIIYGDPVIVPSGMTEAQRDELGKSLGEQITRLENLAEDAVQSSRPRLDPRAMESGLS